MFSFKLDLLFPSIGLAKATAKKLNSALKKPPVTGDPRELKRMHDELRLAREKVRAQVAAGRHFL